MNNLIRVLKDTIMEVLCKGQWTALGSSCYMIVDPRNDCSERSYMAKIEDTEENDMLKSFVKKKSTRTVRIGAERSYSGQGTYWS